MARRTSNTIRWNILCGNSEICGGDSARYKGMGVEANRSTQNLSRCRQSERAWRTDSIVSLVAVSLFLFLSVSLPRECRYRLPPTLCNTKAPNGPSSLLSASDSIGDSCVNAACVSLMEFQVWILRRLCQFAIGADSNAAQSIGYSIYKYPSRSTDPFRSTPGNCRLGRMDCIRVLVERALETQR